MVVAIMAIAATVLIPNMTHVASFQAEAVVRQIVNDLSFAQTDSMTRQTQRRVTFEADGSGYRLLGGAFDHNTDVLFDPISSSGDGLYIVDFTIDDRFSSIHVVSVDFDGTEDYITYDELGGPIASDGSPSIGGRIEIVGESQRFEILVSPFTGRIDVNEIAF